ncbi:MAG: alanine racemase [Actinomycetota bacterium]
MSGLTRDEVERRGHGVWTEIDLGAIRHNVAELGSKAPNSEVMGVVKGYAYGHGNPAAARAMLQAGATRLGVARVAEALHLREAGITEPLHVFTEPHPRSAATMLDYDLTPTVYSQEFAQSLSAAARAEGRRIPVHVKLDSGMHRVGIMAADVPDAIRTLGALDGIVIEGAWSHFAVADLPDHPFTQRQFELFERLVDTIEDVIGSLRYKHMANSAATLSLPESHFDIVRPGVAAYGLWPGPHLVGSADLRPSMSLRARANASKVVPAGERLSYGLRYELERDSRVVTVPVGYADGFDRGFSGRADVLIGGRRHRVSGTVCMDQFLVDVGDDPVEIGAVATLIGADGEERVTAEELADAIGTINYEITTRIASRVPRVYLNETVQVPESVSARSSESGAG